MPELQHKTVNVRGANVLEEVRKAFPRVERHVVHSALEFPEPEPALRFYRQIASTPCTTCRQTEAIALACSRWCGARLKRLSSARAYSGAKDVWLLRRGGLTP